MAQLKYGPNTSARMGKTASAKARRVWWKTWKLQFSIFIPESPLPDHHYPTLNHKGLNLYRMRIRLSRTLLLLILIASPTFHVGFQQKPGRSRSKVKCRPDNSV